MWNVEEIVKINKDSEHGWGWLRLGFTEATVYQLQAAEATTWPYWPPPQQHSCRGTQRVSQVLKQPASSLPTFLTYLCNNVYQALEPKDIASILALVHHTVLAIQPAGGVRKVDHAHIH